MAIPNYLVLSYDNKLRLSAALWQALAQQAHVEIRKFDDKDSASLKQLTATLREHSYDRVIFDGNIRRLGRHYTALAGIPRLVILDEDLCRQFCKESAYHGLFGTLFKTLGPHRLVTSNLRVKKAFEADGLCVSYLPKAYDQNCISFLGTPRDIEIGFIGRTKHKVYKHRRALLKQLQKNLDIKLIRTAEGAEYNSTLNRIRYFISADAWFDEFMIKNYEAMAAGCVLCALPTTDEEAELLGFRDMENIVFYRNAEELTEKIGRLRRDPELATNIARAGRKLAETRHRLADRSADMAQILQEPILPHPAMNWMDRIRYCKLLAYLLITGN